MKTAYWIGTVAALAVLSSVAAYSQSLKIREQIEKEDKALVEYADKTNQACGTAMAIKFDWKGAKDDDVVKWSVSGTCDHALDGIRQVCATPAGKAAVKEKIKSVTCRFGTAGETTLKDGAFSWNIDFPAGSNTVANSVHKYLQDQL
jgi:hypothetical protein